MKLSKHPLATLKALRRFRHAEDGSFTIEAVIWMPIFAILLAIIMNLTMMFYHESQMLRVAQDATRAFSLGRLTEEEAVAFITSTMSYTNAVFDVTINTIGPDNDIVQTLVYTSADQLMPFSLMSAPFQNLNVGVSTQYLIEY